MDRRTVGSGADGGFGEELAFVGQCEVLRCAGHVKFSRAVCSTTGGQELISRISMLAGVVHQTNPLGVMGTSVSWFLGEPGNFVAAQL